MCFKLTEKMYTNMYLALETINSTLYQHYIIYFHLLLLLCHDSSHILKLRHLLLFYFHVVQKIEKNLSETLESFRRENHSSNNYIETLLRDANKDLVPLSEN